MGAAGGGCAVETELKLGGDAAALDRGWRAVVPEGGEERSERLRSTYFDTGDFRLRRRGFTLRIRAEGDRLIQTLKAAPAPGSGAALRRREWSQPVESLAPRLPAAADPAVRAAMRMIRPAELAPAFSADVLRRTATIRVAVPGRAGAVVEVARDSGEIAAGGKRAPVSELELELREGPPSALYDLAMAVQSRAPLRLQTASKAKRGYVLAAGEGYAGQKARVPALEPGISVDKALDGILRACLDHCVANQDAVLAGTDPKGVHQFRVALRRLRSAFAVFGAVLPLGDTAPLDHEAKRFLGALGPARDWDVFIAETLTPLRAVRPRDSSLEALAEAAWAARRRAYERTEALRAPGYTAFLLALGRWIETAGWRGGESGAALDRPLARLAGALLDERHGRVLKRGRGLARQSDERRHRLRIALKKLRYASEFFATQFPGAATRRHVKAARRLQDDFGRLNDAAVAERLLEGLVASHAGGAALAPGAGQAVGWNARARSERLAAIAGRWRRFAALPPYWRGDGKG